MAEAMIAAGRELGLSHEIASRLAVATIAGAGRLMAEDGATPTALRTQVTSPNGTTAAGLEVLIRSDAGIEALVAQTVAAAAARSRELAEG